MTPYNLNVNVGLSLLAFLFGLVVVGLLFGGLFFAGFGAGLLWRGRREPDRYRGRRRRQPEPVSLFDDIPPPTVSLATEPHLATATSHGRRTSDHPDATVILQRIEDPS